MVLPNFTSIIDEEGCEHKVKIEESLVKKTKRGNEMPDDKFSVSILDFYISSSGNLYPLSLAPIFYRKPCPNSFD